MSKYYSKIIHTCSDCPHAEQLDANLFRCKETNTEMTGSEWLEDTLDNCPLQENK